MCLIRFYSLLPCKIVSLLFILLFGCVLQDNFVVSMYLYNKFTDSDSDTDLLKEVCV